MTSQDKTGATLNAQRFQMVEDIAQELRKDIVFPTCFDAAMKVRDALRHPDLSLDRLARIVSLEPLICVKLLRLANSAAYNRDRREVANIKSAIQRLGLETVRTTSLAVAMDQLMHSKAVAVFEGLARLYWDHTLMAAAAARVIARHFTRVDADEAMLAGLVHDLGAFYMLYRAAKYPELRERPDTVKYLTVQWHESIGESLLTALGLPSSVVNAVRDDDHPRPAFETPRNLSQVVFVANLLAGGSFEWQGQDFEDGSLRPELADDQYLVLMDEIKAETAELRSIFA